MLAGLAERPDRPAALATLVSIEGSSYRRLGARRLLFDDGTTLGSISGGCLESDLLEHGKRTLRAGEPQTVVYDTTADDDLMWGVGLGCRGVVHVAIESVSSSASWVRTLRENFRARRDTRLAVVHGPQGAAHFGTHLADELPLLSDGAPVYRETVTPPASLIVCGAGDDAVPIVRLSRELGLQVTVFDSRRAYATPARFPEAEKVIVAPPGDAQACLPVDRLTYVVVMTHRYQEDLALLRYFLTQPPAYLGVLGPLSRTQRLLDELAGEGLSVSDALRERFFAPVGLDLGGDTPEAVALSILAELQALHASRAAMHLRDRSGPIHG